MTAFASRTGATETASWTWDLRSVNGRGLDLRLRLPDGLDGLEAGIRTALTGALSRGNVTVTLKLARSDVTAGLALDEAQLDLVLTALETVQQRAFDLGVTLGQPTAADVLSQRGVVVSQAAEEVDTKLLVSVLLKDFKGLLGDFQASRKAEGKALGQILSKQVDRIDALTEAAAVCAKAREAEVKAALATALRRVLDNVDMDEARLAQELALLAVKADITEEIDRLATHVTAARDLIADDKPKGRRLDFLSQEFNREANTLCSKSGNAELTRIGLELKTVIDQMREQIQNVE
jgi:uncharacterized protein (TIGR00255 family)